MRATFGDSCQHMIEILSAAIARINKTSLRFCAPIALLVLVRTSCAAWLFATLRTDGVFRVPFMQAFNLPANWLYLFAAWDSAFYISIAESWYPQVVAPVWAYFPLYPGTARVISLTGLNAGYSLFAVATVSGLLSMAVFQQVAEAYLSRPQAISATILFFLLPPVFVFSGVIYSEPLFLLLTLLAYRFHLGGRDLWANFAAGLVALTKIYGILIIVPFAYNYLRRRQYRNLAYLAMPLVALATWAIYVYEVTGTMAFLAARQFWYSEIAEIIRINMLRLIHGDATALPTLFMYAQSHLMIGVAALVSITLFIGLCLKIMKIDRALVLYALTTVTAIVYFGFFTAMISFPRYIGFMFPIGLPLHTRRRWLLAGAAIVFAILGYIAWKDFLLIDGVM